MELESVTLKLPRDLLSGAQRVATARDVTIGHMVRQLLKREVDRQLSRTGPTQTDQRLLAALQALLARDMAEAGGWDDLAERLRPHGYEMRPSGAGCVLYKSSCDTRICKGSELGFPYAALVERFGGPMPSHAAFKTALGVMPAGRIDPTRRAMIATHIESARSWPDLINRLACSGLELRAVGQALAVHVVSTGRHLCNSGAVGAEYEQLIERFGKPLPSRPSGDHQHPDVPPLGGSAEVIAPS
ncbi:hypothetical protein [Sulfitobacter guttiformis]|nr:hypothetical protein [Sulfitobacter guttiformis]KIN74679.1 hypothetical protein Z949_3878 [Sulfitobacter guttiformis KCTC 32187]